MTIYTYIPFTYLIGWTDQSVYYYGVRYGKGSNPKELWVSYFTSSKIVKEYRNTFGEPDIIQIRRVFSNRKAAQLWESTVLRRMNTALNPKFLNRSNGSEKFYDFGPRSEETKAKISLSRSNAIMPPMTEETKSKISTALKGKPKSLEAREKMSQAKSGTTWSESHRENMKNSRLRTPKLGIKRGPYKRSELT